MIQTYTGRHVDPVNLRPEDVCIEDVAHALSMLCRYGGHCRRFYSVAEHSVHVSRLVPRHLALWGLLHDASEAYLGDVSRDTKRQPELAGYRDAEERAMSAVASAFRLPWPMVRAVHEADRLMLWPEVRDLMEPDTDAWTSYGFPWKASDHVETYAFGPGAAEEYFMDRYRKLVCQR